MEELRRKVKTGALNVVLTNEDDAEIGRFSFNPVDLNIIRRYEEVVANLEKMEVPEDATEKDILELSDRLEEQIDYLLNSKASKSVFAICNPLTLTESGDFFIENIIVEIAGTNYNNSVHSVCECVDYLRKTPFGELSYGK